MKNNKRIYYLILPLGIVLAVILAGSLFGQSRSEMAGSANDPHLSPDHQDHEEQEGHAVHAGHDTSADLNLANPDEGDEASHDEEQAAHRHEGEHSDQADHADEERVHFDEPSILTRPVRLATAGPGRIQVRKRFPGEIRINADRVAHIVPRAPGIVREVLKTVGDTAQAGEVMAWLESAELGQAKIDYLTQWTELSCCNLDLTRAQEVHDNTRKYLEMLQTTPSLEQLRKANHTAMGEYRSVLVSAYADYVFAKVSYEREKELYEKKIGSGEDFLAADSRFKKADAQYAATLDSVEYKIQRDLLEAKRARQIREIELLGAERRLHIFGLSSKEIKGLQLSSGAPVGDHESDSACTDPNCQECRQSGQKRSSDAEVLPHSHARQRLAWYPLRAPFEGTIIDKHISLGEKLGDEADAYTIADLSSSWVDISIYQKDLSDIEKGRQVKITAPDSALSTTGRIQFVSPIVDEKTRTALARVVLPNPERRWRPGLFVEASVVSEEEDAPIVIPKTAVQNLQGESIVFVETKEGFEPVEVQLGHSDGTHVEIVTGLEAGQHYVAEGAFELKAKIVTSGLGAHAGHGH